MASVDDPPLYLYGAPPGPAGSESSLNSQYTSGSELGSRQGTKSPASTMSRSRSSSSTRHALPATPPETDGEKESTDGTCPVVARNLDYLVHKLNRKPILQDSIRWRFVREEKAQFQDKEPIKSSDQRPMQPLEPTPAPDAIPTLAMRYDHTPSIAPIQDVLLPPARIQTHNRVMDSSSDNPFPKTCDFRRPRRATETRLHRSASNHRMLDLVTGMIENGVQCHVQTPTPPSPTRILPPVLTSTDNMRCNETDIAPDPEILPSRLNLEVDMSLGDVGEEIILNESLALREASCPAGISKLGVLKYRSSSEAAHSCKNMRKAVPRMRRRRRTNPTPAAGPCVPPQSTTI